MLGCALLSIHGALEDFFREWLSSHTSMPLSVREKVVNQRDCQWDCLIKLAQQYADLTNDKARKIRHANGKRAGFAHGGRIEWGRLDVETYADFVQRWIEQHERCALREDTAAIPEGEIDMYLWEEELIETMEEEGWRRSTAYNVPPHFMRLMRPLDDNRVAQLIAHFDTLKDFEIRPRSAPYGHMGATITDAALQARWNYRRAVQPRVQRVRTKLDGKPTTRDFLGLLKGQEGAERALSVRGGKAIIAHDLTTLLAAEGVETEADLRSWIVKSENREQLLTIRGVGPKTADYLGLLVGISDAVAVDVHVRRFLAKAGVTTHSYDDAAAVVAGAAKILGHTPADLEGSIWRYQRRRS